MTRRLVVSCISGSRLPCASTKGPGTFHSVQRIICPQFVGLATASSPTRAGVGDGFRRTLQWRVEAVPEGTAAEDNTTRRRVRAMLAAAALVAGAALYAQAHAPKAGDNVGARNCT